MDNPKCKCGQPCASYEYMTPNYDDGGSVDSFSPETIYLDECIICVHEHDARNADDDLPF